MPSFVSYLRVSTNRQGRDGYGIEAQRDAVARHVTACTSVIVAEFVEVESGRRNDRPELAKALAACRAHRSVLLIARLDRLARNVNFVSNLMEGGVEFVAADMPTVTRFTIHILAAVAEEEARVISARTKAALAVAKARGTVLGNPRLVPGNVHQARAAAAAKAKQARVRQKNLMPVIAELRTAGVHSLSGLARGLRARGIPTLSGRGTWHPATLKRLLPGSAASRSVVVAGTCSSAAIPTAMSFHTDV